MEEGACDGWGCRAAATGTGGAFRGVLRGDSMRAPWSWSCGPVSYETNLDTMSGFCRVPGEQTLPLGNVEPGEEKRRHEDRHRSTRTAPRGPVPRNPEHPDQAREHPGVVRDEEVPLSGLRARLLSGT